MARLKRVDWKTRRTASAVKDLATLKAKIPAECLLDVRIEPDQWGCWRFFTNTGKGPMLFHVAAAYIDGYLDAWDAQTEARDWLMMDAATQAVVEDYQSLPEDSRVMAADFLRIWARPLKGGV